MRFLGFFYKTKVIEKHMLFQPVSTAMASTAAARLPTVDARDVTPFDTFAADYVAASLRRATCKQCELILLQP